MKKKIMLITTVAVIIALAAAGTALAAEVTNEPLEAADGTGYGYGRNAERGNGQRFAVQADMYETDEEFHAAVLSWKLAVIEAKVADGSLTEEDAVTIREHLTACDGTCETEGENPNRPEDGWGIFGQGGQGSQAEKAGRGNGGSRGNGGQMRGNGLKSSDCELEEPLQDGSGRPE